MKQPLTPVQKQQKQVRDTLERLCYSIEQAWSFRKIATWADVYKYMPKVANDKDGTLTFLELKAYLAQKKSALQEHFLSQLPVSTNDSQPSQPSNEINLNTERKETTSTKTTEIVQSGREGINSLDSKEENRNIDSRIGNEIVEDLSSTNNYGCVTSPNENYFGYWFQLKAIKEILDDILGFDTSKAKNTNELRTLYINNSKL